MNLKKQAGRYRLAKPPPVEQVALEDMDDLADPGTNPLLLPLSFVGGGDNSEELRFSVIALREAMDSCLGSEARYLIDQCYLEGRARKELALELGLAPSSVTKRIQSAEATLGDYVGFALRAFRTHQRREEDLS
ncbi:MAG: hypothetical protein ACK5LX_15550 [Oscillospiraceae bacterium]